MCTTRKTAGIAVALALLAGAPSRAFAVDCSYYQARAREARAAARENRANGSKIGHGPMAQNYFNAAAALENAAAQYDAKYRECTSSPGPRSSASAPAGVPATEAVQQLGNLLQEKAGAPAAPQDSGRALKQAEQNASEREQEYLREQQSREVAKQLNDAIAAEMARDALNDKIDREMQHSQMPYEFNFGRIGGTGKGQDFSSRDDPRCQACREIGASIVPSGNAEYDTERALRAAIERDACIMHAGGCGGPVSSDAYNYDSKVLREYLANRKSPSPCARCASPAK